MNIMISKTLPEDAAQMIEYLKKIGGETDNLTFGSEGLPITIEDEKAYISSLLESKNSVLFTAKNKENIVGIAGLTGDSRERMSHRGELAISVLKDEWGKGIGSKLMQKVIDFAKNEANTEIISLQVRSDNERAISLYKKYGFEKIGCFKGFFKINGEYVDFDLMNLYL